MRNLNKVLSIVLSVIMILSIIPLTASAAEYTGGCGKNLTWLLDTDTGVLTISGTGAMTNYNDFLNRAPWYQYNNLIVSVYIEEGVTSIGRYSFPTCEQLKQVTISDSVTEIFSKAFEECSKLEKIFVGSGMKKISNDAISEGALLFYSGTKAQWYAIEENSRYSFSKNGNPVHCSDGAIVAPLGSCGENVAWIFDATTGTLTISGEGAMTNYSTGDKPWEIYKRNIHKVVIENGVTTIGGCAFYYYENLSEVTIPESVISIQGEAFKGCSSLARITIPTSVKEFGYRFSEEFLVIDYCGTSEEWGTIVHNNKENESYLHRYFVNCQDKKVYPSGVCGDNLTWIIDDTKTLIISGEGDMWDYYDWYEGNCAPWGDNAERVIIGEGVTSIGREAFRECKKLLSVSISSSVKSIEYCAFMGCTQLTTLTIGNGIEFIDAYVFDGCTNLSDVYYAGFQEEWNAITIDKRNSKLDETKIHYCHTTIGVHPTCTEPGIITYICDCCNSEICVNIAPSERYHVYECLEMLPTCTKHGVTNYNCENCESSYWEYSANPTGHTLNDEGICEVCGEKEVSTNHVNTQMLSVESVLAMVTSLLAKLFGIFTVA